MKDALKDILFFSCLSPVQMDNIMSHIEPLELNSGEILFEEGDISHYVCFVISGSLEVVKTNRWQNHTSVISTLEEGACIGAISLVDPTPRSATVRASTRTKLAILTQSAFDTIVKTESELGVNVLKGVIQTLKENLQPNVSKLIDQVAA